MGFLRLFRGFLEQLLDLRFGRAVEDRRDKRHIHATGDFTQVRLENLTEVHAAWNAERVKDQIDGRAIGQVWHIFGGQDLSDHTFIAVTVSELVADLQLAALRDVHAHHLAHAGLQVHALVAALEAHGANDDAALTGWDAQGRVFDFPCLLTEDRAQQAFLGRWLSLALEAGVTDQNIALLDFRADADDAVLVEVAQRSLRQARNVPRNLLGPQLRIPCLALLLFYVNAGVVILAHQRFRHHNRVFVVVAVKRHDRNRDVVTQRQTPEL